MRSLTYAKPRLTGQVFLFCTFFFLLFESDWIELRYVGGGVEVRGNNVISACMHTLPGFVIEITFPYATERTVKAIYVHTTASFTEMTVN